MNTLLEPPYTILEVSGGVTFHHVNDGTKVTLYIDDVAQATTDIEGDIFLDDVSQVSGLPVSNITLFEIHKKLLKPTI